MLSSESSEPTSWSDPFVKHCAGIETDVPCVGIRGESSTIMLIMKRTG